MLGEWIRRERQRRGWTQEELAVQAGLSKQVVGHIETNKRGGSSHTLAALAAAFGVSVDFFIALQNSTSALPDPLDSADLPPDVIAKLRAVQPLLTPQDWAETVAYAQYRAHQNALRQQQDREIAEEKARKRGGQPQTGTV